jgi:hypothetical protein
LLVVFLYLNVPVLFVAIAGDLYSWLEYSQLDPGADASETLLVSDVVVFLTALVQFPFAIFLGVTFLRWIYRANQNLQALSTAPMTFSPGWSVGWYFVPIANLFKPYLVMKEIWIVAHRGLSTESLLLGWWWGLWIVSNFVARFSIKFGFHADNAEGDARSAIVDAVSDGIDIALTIVALMLVSAIADAYRANYVEPGADYCDDADTPAGDTGFAEEQ